MSIRESQIEEVLATYPDICSELLGLGEGLTLIARQMILPSGDRLDLFFTHRSRLILVELKVVPFKYEFLEQTLNYRDELRGLQIDERLIAGDIFTYLLCPSFLSNQMEECNRRCVTSIEYSPSHVLDMFFSRFGSIAAFFALQPPDHGVWSIHLLNPILYSLRDGPLTIGDIRTAVGLAQTTTRSYLRFAEEMKLVYRDDSRTFRLTEIGISYVDNREPGIGTGLVSETQASVLRDMIIGDPFASRVILGIYTMVEVVFNLARNIHPVPEQMVITHFRDASGKAYTWPSPKAASHGAHIYSNYAIELGLIGKFGGQFYLTPEGVRFILLLQLHKSIKIVDALGLARS